MIGIVLEGDKQLAKALKALPDRVFNRVIKRANTRAMQPVLKMAQQLVPIRFGVLKRSLGYKTKVYPKKGVVFTAVGARVGFHVSAATLNAIPKGLRNRITNGGKSPLRGVLAPTKYAHLVELGHGGPHAAPAHPFLRPAWDANRGNMMARLGDEIGAGIEREAEKAAHE